MTPDSLAAPVAAAPGSITPVLRLAVALGIGLLIGLERERRKGRVPAAAGIRTFALAALLGGLSALLPGMAVFAVTGAAVGALALVAYLRSSGADPGLTTEVALLVTFLLGGLALRDPTLASGVGVVVTVLLAARGWLHRFVRSVLDEDEVHDALVFAAAALVVLPLAPDRGYGPFGALNPRTLWRLAVLVMAVSGAGYVAVRILGPRAGLPLAGFAGGFVSSTATIGSMGARAHKSPRLHTAAAAGAVLSTVATVVQLGVVLAATHAGTLRAMAGPLAGAGVAALAYGGFFTWRNARAHRGPRTGSGSSKAEEGERPKGRAFDLRVALLFAAVVSAILLLAAALTQWLGRAGLVAGVAASGFADTHAAAIAVASLAAAGQVTPADAVLPILVAFTTNTVSKAVDAITTGDRAFVVATLPGLLLVVVAAWLGWLLARPGAPA
jgi:uncharacterized membrane protein (DUF4010 family)